MTDHMSKLEEVAASDVKSLREKEKTYGGSWKKRGGVGAFMMLARKWDRLENILSAFGVNTLSTYDIFAYCEVDTSGDDGTVLAEVRDLRRYLMLVEAEILARMGGPTDTESASMRAYINRAGTPEDGGHHAKKSEKYPEFCLRDDMTDEMAPLYVQVPKSDLYTLDRRLMDDEELDMVPRYDAELNYSEWSQLTRNKQLMYSYVVTSGKYVIWKCFRELWTN